MIKIRQPDTLRWPVKVRLPKDGGGFVDEGFDALFKRLTRVEVDNLAERVASGEISGVDAVKSIVVGWSGVTDDGADVPFSAAALDQLLNIPGVALATYRAFADAVNGAATKN